MLGASKIHHDKQKGDLVEVTPQYADYIYIDEEYSLHKDTYLRIIKTDIQTYKEYKTTDSIVPNEKELHITSFIAPIETWKPINLSKEITIVWTEGDPLPEYDLSKNLAAVTGLPPSFSVPLKPKEKSSWHYKIKGIYYLNEGEDRYFFRAYYFRDPEKKKLYERGTHALNMEILNNLNFNIVETSYFGD